MLRFFSLIFVMFFNSPDLLLSMDIEYHSSLEEQYQKACLLYDQRKINSAYNLYLEIAEKGHAKSLNSLGSINESNGNLKEALEFYKLAYEQGCEIAYKNFENLNSIANPNQNSYLEEQYQKACLLYDQRKINSAYNLYLEIAEKGHAKSLNSLGSINESNGNLKEALEFYKLAYEQGCEIAYKNFENLSKDTHLDNQNKLTKNQKIKKEEYDEKTIDRRKEYPYSNRDILETKKRV